MNKEELESLRQWTDSRVRRITEEVKSFKLQRKRLDELIEDDVKEMLQLMDSLRKSTEEYLEDKPYEAIEYFLKERGYSYSVEDILEGYNKRLKGYYNSYTMDDCINNLESHLKVLSEKERFNI